MAKVPTRSEQQVAALETAKGLAACYPMDSRNFSPMDFGEISALIEFGNGFDPCNNETLPTKLMLVITELVEAVDWCHTGEGDPLEEELADVMIRLFAALHRYAEVVTPDGTWTWRYSTMFNGDVEAQVRRFRLKATVEQGLWPIVKLLAYAMEEYRHANYGKALNCMEHALALTAEIADSMKLDWKEAVKMKTNKNLGRPYLHGKVSTA